MIYWCAVINENCGSFNIKKYRIINLENFCQVTMKVKDLSKTNVKIM